LKTYLAGSRTLKGVMKAIGGGYRNPYEPPLVDTVVTIRMITGYQVCKICGGSHLNDLIKFIAMSNLLRFRKSSVRQVLILIRQVS